MAKKDKNSDQSPNSFEPQKPKSQDRKVIYQIAFVLVAVALAVVYFISQSGQTTKKVKEPTKEVVDQRPLLPMQNDGRGLVIPEEKKKPEPEKEEPLIKIVGPPDKNAADEALRMEQDEMRRRRHEANQAALTSGMLIRRQENAAAMTESASTNRSGSDSGASATGTSEYDPAADKDKEAFFDRADAKEWISPYTREAGRPFELKTGTVIPGLMVSGVNSDLPGSLIAQVSQNVYDSASGKYLLIPQGSKLYGVYDSRVIYGQSRVLIAWNRVIFPDGSSVTLGAMPGADQAGYAGFEDKVDNHYLRIFGSAIMMSLITGGMTYAVDNSTNSNNNGDSTTLQDEMTAALANQLGQTTLKLLERNISIKPTLEIRPGYRFNVVITKDVIFKGAYR